MAKTFKRRCPECGGRMVLVKERDEDDGSMWWLAACDSCGGCVIVAPGECPQDVAELLWGSDIDGE